MFKLPRSNKEEYTVVRSKKKPVVSGLYNFLNSEQQKKACNNHPKVTIVYKDKYILIKFPSGVENASLHIRVDRIYYSENYAHKFESEYHISYKDINDVIHLYYHQGEFLFATKNKVALENNIANHLRRSFVFCEKFMHDIFISLKKQKENLNSKVIEYNTLIIDALSNPDNPELNEEYLRKIFKCYQQSLEQLSILDEHDSSEIILSIGKSVDDLIVYIRQRAYDKQDKEEEKYVTDSHSSTKSLSIPSNTKYNVETSRKAIKNKITTIYLETIAHIENIKKSNNIEIILDAKKKARLLLPEINKLYENESYKDILDDKFFDIFNIDLLLINTFKRFIENHDIELAISLYADIKDILNLEHYLDLLEYIFNLANLPLELEFIFVKLLEELQKNNMVYQKALTNKARIYDKETLGGITILQTIFMRLVENNNFHIFRILYTQLSTSIIPLSIEYKVGNYQCGHSCDFISLLAGYNGSDSLILWMLEKGTIENSPIEEIHSKELPDMQHLQIQMPKSDEGIEYIKYIRDIIPGLNFLQCCMNFKVLQYETLLKVAEHPTTTLSDLVMGLSYLMLTTYTHLFLPSTEEEMEISFFYTHEERSKAISKIDNKLSMPNACAKSIVFFGLEKNDCSEEDEENIKCKEKTDFLNEVTRIIFKRFSESDSRVKIEESVKLQKFVSRLQRQCDLIKSHNLLYIYHIANIIFTALGDQKNKINLIQHKVNLLNQYIKTTLERLGIKYSFIDKLINLNDEDLAYFFTEMDKLVDDCKIKNPSTVENILIDIFVKARLGLLLDDMKALFNLIISSDQRTKHIFTQTLFTVIEFLKHGLSFNVLQTNIRSCVPTPTGSQTIYEEKYQKQKPKSAIYPGAKEANEATRKKNDTVKTFYRKAGSKLKTKQ